MKITAIEAIPFAIPYVKGLHFASGEVLTAEHVLVRVHTDDGVVGSAEAPPRPFTYGETQASIIAVIEEIFAPQLIGLTLHQREVAAALIGRTVGNPTAKAAIDMAMVDALGRTLDVRVTDLLGGYCDRMRVSHILGFDQPDVMVAEAERIRDAYGIRTFKVKVGRHPISLDVTVVSKLRDRLGADVELYVDGNRGWTAAESADAMRQMSDLGLLFVEELCAADDILGRRWLVGKLGVPFIADESAATSADLVREILAGSATAVSIKTARTGFTQSQRVHAVAEVLGLEMVIGNQIDSQLGTACSLAFGAAHRRTSIHAGELSNFLGLRDDLLVEPLQIAGGEMQVGSGAGIGVEVDLEKLAHFRQDR